MKKIFVFLFTILFYLSSFGQAESKTINDTFRVVKRGGGNAVLDVEGYLQTTLLPTGSPLDSLVLWDPVSRRFRKTTKAAFLFNSIPQYSIIGLADSLLNKVSRNGSYSNPSWINSLALSKTTGLTDSLLNKVSRSGSYSDPSWITSLAWSKITGVPAASTNADSLGHVAASGYQLKYFTRNAYNPGTIVPVNGLDTVQAYNIKAASVNTGGMYVSADAQITGNTTFTGDILKPTMPTCSGCVVLGWSATSAKIGQLSGIGSVTTLSATALPGSNLALTVTNPTTTPTLTADFSKKPLFDTITVNNNIVALGIPRALPRWFVTYDTVTHKFSYYDTLPRGTSGSYLPLSGGTMTGNIAMGTNNISMANGAHLQLGGSSATTYNVEMNTTNYNGIRMNNTDGTFSRIQFQSSGVDKAIIYHSNSAHLMFLASQDTTDVLVSVNNNAAGFNALRTSGFNGYTRIADDGFRTPITHNFEVMGTTYVQGLATLAGGATATSFTKTGSTSSDALIGDGSTIKVSSGSYMISYTGVTNFSYISSTTATYLRVGNTVTVSGYFACSSLSTGVTTFHISLPFASNLSNGNVDCAGSGTARGTAVGNGILIYAGAANAAAFDYQSTVVTPNAMAISFTFQYTIN